MQLDDTTRRRTILNVQRINPKVQFLKNFQCSFFQRTIIGCFWNVNYLQSLMSGLLLITPRFLFNLNHLVKENLLTCVVTVSSESSSENILPQFREILFDAFQVFLKFILIIKRWCLMISRLVNFLRAASVSVVSVKNSKYEIITTLYFLQQTTNNSVRLIAQSPTCFKLTEYIIKTSFLKWHSLLMTLNLGHDNP